MSTNVLSQVMSNRFAELKEIIGWHSDVPELFGSDLRDWVDKTERELAAHGVVRVTPLRRGESMETVEDR